MWIIYQHSLFYIFLVSLAHISYSDVHPEGVQQGDIRLFGDVRNGYGAVQIYTTTHGWTGICPDRTWTSGYPSAICRDLGYSGGTVVDPVLTTTGPGGQNLSRLIYEMSCPSGSDSLDECSYMLNDDKSAVCSSPDGLFAAVECGEFLPAHTMTFIDVTS